MPSHRSRRRTRLHRAHGRPHQSRRSGMQVRVQNKQEAGRRIVERTARTRSPIGCDAGGVPGRPAHQRAPEAGRHTLRDRVVALVLLRQPQIPERVIHADPDAWCRGDLQKMGVENHEEWRAVTRNPDVVRAMLEDCRAGLTIDREHSTKRRITPGARGSAAPFWSCGRCKTTWRRTRTAIRVTSGSTGPTTCRAMASTRATTWPRRPPARSRLPEATFSPSDCLGTPTTQNASPKTQHAFSRAAHGWRRDALSRGTIGSTNGAWPPCSTSQESTPTCGSTPP